MKTTFLFGAGVSVVAGVPSANNMTQKMLEIIDGKKDDALVSQLLRYVVGGLVFHNTTYGGSPYAGVNIEDLFNAIQTLKDRRSMDAAPFIGSWHFKLDDIESHPPSPDIYQHVYEAIAYQLVNDLKSSIGKVRVERYAIDEINRAILSLIGDKRYGGNSESPGKTIFSSIDKLPKQIADGLSAKPLVAWNNFNISMHTAIQQATGKRKNRVFERALDIMVKTLKYLVWVSDEEKTRYFDVLIDWINDSNCAAIATLNYDNVVELSARRMGRGIHNGLSNINETGEFGFRSDCINLIKLHGSINWTYEKDQGGNKSHEVIDNQGDKFADEDYMPAVIFGQKNKLTAKGPFLDLYRAYRESLAKSKCLVVIGYSFNDDHINQSIINWGRKGDRKLIILDPQIDSLRRDYRHKFHDIATAIKTENIACINGYFSQDFSKCLAEIPL